MVPIQDEKTIRMYTLEKKDGGGNNITETVRVTTKRLIYSVYDANATPVYRQDTQCALCDIHHMEYGTRRDRNGAFLAVGAIFLLLATCFLMSAVTARSFDAVVFTVSVCAGVIGAAFLWEGKKSVKRVWLDIFTCVKNSALPFGMELSALRLSRSGVSPVFEKMIGELPAIIADIGTMGNAAADKWGEV